MTSKRWFRRKSYGWGWTPVSWQGWLALVLYIAVNVLIFRLVDLHSHSNSDTLINFAPRFLLLTVGFYLICTFAGEKPKWQWGNHEK